jgi:effector-binding domain-containing protein
MRALKTLLIILIAVVLLAIVLGLVGPKQSHLERKTMIAAPSSLVWDHLKSLKAQNEWSPFLAMDPEAKVNYEGTDGEVGSKSSWEGKQTGEGDQTVADVEPGKHIGVDLHFIKPMEGKAKGAFDLVAKGDSTEVTWSFDSENGFVSRIIYVFKDMDALMGPMFSSGLEKLKQLCEADVAERAAELKARTFGGYTIDTVDRPAMSYLGKRATVKWKDLYPFFATNFPLASKTASKAGWKLAGAPSGIYFSWDTAGKSTDVMAGIPVQNANSAMVDGLVVQEVPAGKALMVAYHGDYNKTGDAHAAMEQMIKANGLQKRDAVIEEYVTDPMQEPDTAKWLTNIYYLIK